MKLSGFTDEAARDLAGQIKVTRELGWSYLSLRMVDGVSIHDLPEVAFEQVCEQIEAAGLQVAEFGTLIGSWSKNIDSDWKITLQEVDRCIPRMQRLGVRYARIMSYAQNPWGEEQYEAERFRRLRIITQRFADAGLSALHENCMNWGGFSAEHTLRLLEEVPGLQLVFDTGNPVFQRDRSQAAPYPWQDAFAFYRKVRPAIAHVHIKDAIMHTQAGEPEYTFAGAGQAQIPAIIQDLLKNGYDGFLAIEPHMGKVFHLEQQESHPEREYQIYLEYGQRFASLVKDIEAQSNKPD